MRQEIMEMIRKNKEWLNYLRKEPSWYRLLSRDPYQIETFQKASLQFYKKTFPDRLGRFNDSLQMASALMYMMQSQFSQPATEAAQQSESTTETASESTTEASSEAAPETEEQTGETTENEQ
ncbi:YlbE-like family protein [Bacillus sp. FJAT-27231]|uniref:YlbE-like family protein n=1 Tax=Bacillus sp. FJAT-27231 TaxID=1679168 RepID=UPI0009E19690|nr:YlbE-like family protein [Bacillus sp. FJAT-27231]